MEERRRPPPTPFEFCVKIIFSNISGGKCSVLNVKFILCCSRSCYPLFVFIIPSYQFYIIIPIFYTIDQLWSLMFTPQFIFFILPYCLKREMWETIHRYTRFTLTPPPKATRSEITKIQTFQKKYFGHFFFNSFRVLGDKKTSRRKRWNERKERSNIIWEKHSFTRVYLLCFLHLKRYFFERGNKSTTTYKIW